MKGLLKKLLSLLLVIVLLFIGKFFYECAYSPYKQAINHPDNLVVMYRPGCHRCRKVLPQIMPRLIFSTHRDYLMNANNLESPQLQKLGLTVTPGFRIHHHTYQTISPKKISKLLAER